MVFFFNNMFTNWQKKNKINTKVFILALFLKKKCKTNKNIENNFAECEKE